MRWHTVAQALALVRRRPGITRAALARELKLTSGFAAELVSRMRQARLLTETPAAATGRGRPTTVLEPHPDGPMVLAIELRQDVWRHALVTVDGQLHDVRSHRHRDRDPATVLAAMRGVVDQTGAALGPRLRAVALAAAGTVRDHRLVQATTLGWGETDLTALTRGIELPLLVGNDATLAGVAEARTGAASTTHTALHLITTTGIGGVVTVDGQPLTGTHGAAGEFGHLPLGDRRLACPCGARGCWDLEVDGRALARHLGEPAPANPYDYALAVLARAAAADDGTADRALDGAGQRASERATERAAEGAVGGSAERAAVDAVAEALGSGIAGLVNICDPGLVTFAGLGPVIRRVAGPVFERAYIGGLMRGHRADPPAIVEAAHGDDGPLRGAALMGLDHITAEDALAAWSGLER
ncbi:ROK family protein [Dactylosporangium sp. NPDC051541]|uniref:ROK family transcriptional regulator n=1 Tax=Dactylosporangium sp. NPDC051541 TaxID=3363977 RepID=UPI0037AD1FE1